MQFDQELQYIYNIPRNSCVLPLYFLMKIYFAQIRLYIIEAVLSLIYVQFCYSEQIVIIIREKKVWSISLEWP